MKFLLKVFTNQIGIFFNIVHWTIVTYAFLTEGNPFARQGSYHHCEYPLFEWLIPVNVVPLMFISLIYFPMDMPLNKDELANMQLRFISVLLITFQWALVGFIISYLTKSYRLRKEKIFLS